MKPTTPSTTAFVALLLCLLASPCLGQVTLLETTFDDPSSLDDWSYVGTGEGYIEWVADAGNPGGALVLHVTTMDGLTRHRAASRCYEVRPGDQFFQVADAYSDGATCAFSILEYTTPDCSDGLGSLSPGTVWGLDVWERVSGMADNSDPNLRGVRFAVGANAGNLPRSCRIDNFIGTGPLPTSDIPTASTIGMILLGIGIAAFAWRLLAST